MSTKPEDIYAAARREWDERYGTYKAAARNWRLVSLGLLAVTGIAVGGAFRDRWANHIVPYVVERDHLGTGIAISRAAAAAPTDPREIRKDLTAWIVNVRSVSTDDKQQRTFIGDAYNYVAGGSVAAAKLTDWYSKHDPIARGKHGDVAVSVEGVLPRGADSWRIDWCEDSGSLQDGQPAISSFWEAEVSIVVSPPTTDASADRNPFGIFVRSFDWTEMTTTPGQTCS